MGSQRKSVKIYRISNGFRSHFRGKKVEISWGSVEEPALGVELLEKWKISFGRGDQTEVERARLNLGMDVVIAWVEKCQSVSKHGKRKRGSRYRAREAFPAFQQRILRILVKRLLPNTGDTLKLCVSKLLTAKKVLRNVNLLELSRNDRLLCIYFCISLIFIDS